MTRDPIDAVTNAIAEHVYGHEEVWRAAAVAAIRAVKAQLELDAAEQRFLSDKDGMYCGAEQIGSWVEGK